MHRFVSHLEDVYALKQYVRAPIIFVHIIYSYLLAAGFFFILLFFLFFLEEYIIIINNKDVVVLLLLYYDSFYSYYYYEYNKNNEQQKNGCFGVHTLMVLLPLGKYLKGRQHRSGLLFFVVVMLF